MSKLTKNVIDSVTEAYAGSLFVRSLLENQFDITKSKKLRIDELENITDKLMIIETEKFSVLLYILSKGAASISEIANAMQTSEFMIMKHVLALQNEGWLELRDQEKLIYGSKVLMTKFEEKLELDLISPWNLHSAYDPIKIIVDAHLCCLCGACKAVCPVEAITIKDDKPIIDDEKCIHCGLCNYHCPRTLMPLNILKTFVAGPQANFFQDLNAQPFGPYKIIKSAQTQSDKIKAVCQDGGMVTTFLQYLFEKNKIDGAVVVKRKANSWDTASSIVTNIDDLLEASGTKYAVAPTFEAFNTAREVGCKRLAFVGTPCQVQAMRKYQVYSNIFNEVWGNIEYIIGIFCMETFAYDNVVKISEEFCKTPISNVSKMDINKGKFFVYDLNKNASEVEIKEITSLARHACHYCVDLTNELADISCGSIGSGPGWSTVVVRSEKGEKLYDAALKENYFQVKDVPEDKPFGIPLIQKLASGKRTRNFKGLLKILHEAPPYYYNSLNQILKVEEK
ncbi:MAG TPA: Coenzyme F420 hydrogenase/dehydrogenase, beta subunit C-terminal domain [Candidatus Deferrimicrobium sp.]|nr:Coenzyme F420 hydrogenase/dehydrogenase, beta subunit C-terminal domain [Candidatus Deferrimicrobium sp.]